VRRCVFLHTPKRWRLLSRLSATSICSARLRPRTRQNSARRREEILEEAAESAWFFIIQREALKLPYYDELFADFDIPEKCGSGWDQERSPEFFQWFDLTQETA
jgi:hypothetical protein